MDFKVFRDFAIDRGSRAMESIRFGPSERVAGRVFDTVYPLIAARVAEDYEAAIADLEFQLEEATKPKTRRKPIEDLTTDS